MGIGQALGFSVGWTAGAIISGAYFGDKMSPLSDTTVMASSTVGVPLRNQHRHWQRDAQFACLYKWHGRHDQHHLAYRMRHDFRSIDDSL